MNAPAFPSALESFWSRYSRLIVCAFFVVLLGVGIKASRDYGVSWDEPNMQSLGYEVYDYVHGKGVYTTEAGRMFHGPVVEWLLATIEIKLNLLSLVDVIIMRHLVTFLLFYAGVVCFFFLAKKHLKSMVLALFGCLMLALSPRIFAHSFYNSRDIPNLAFFIFGITTLLWYLDKRTFVRAIVHGMVCALAMSLRPTGIFLPLLTVLFLGYQLLMERREYVIHWSREVLMLVLYFIVWAGMTVLLWPLLWTNTLANFFAALSTTTHFRTPVSWYYIPLWIFISTPFLYTFFFVSGIGKLLGQIKARTLLFQRNTLLFWSWLLLPIIAILITRSSIYDDWRHVFFLYPAFVLIALEGLQWLWAKLQTPRFHVLTWAIGCWTVLSMGTTVVWMIVNHPLEGVYFSIPSSMVDAKTLGLDYWGLSFRPAYEWIFAQDDSPKVHIHPTSSPGFFARDALPTALHDRVVLTDDAHADYILDNFGRDHFAKIYDGKFEKIHTISVSGIPVISIYDGRKPITPQ